MLAGADLTLARSPRPTWIIEICRSEFHPGGENPHVLETFDLFWKQGYEARWARPESRRLDRSEICGWMNGQSTGGDFINYIFAAPE